MCVSSWLFAAFYVLHRFLMPRHSPFALISLTLRLKLNVLYEILFKSMVFYHNGKTLLIIIYKNYNNFTSIFKHNIYVWLTIVYFYTIVVFVIQFSMYNTLA